MLARMTSQNQLILPKSIVQSIGNADYFEVEINNGRVILTPVRIQKADAVRAKFEELGISEQDVADAITWARK